MRHIQNAKFLSWIFRNGRNLAEIEVVLKEAPGNTYVAYVERMSNGGYRLSSVIKNKANHELDWYDNDMHSAFVNVTEQFFEQADIEKNRAEREVFLQNILHFTDVAAQIEGR